MAEKKQDVKSCPKGTCTNDRLGSTGGQAVLEGVMMKSRTKVAISVRDVNGKIRTDVKDTKSVSGGILKKIPLIRGIIGFIDSMVLSIDTINKSADMLGLDEEEEETKLEKWLSEHFGKSLVAIASIIGTVLGVVLSVGLFMYLPKIVSNLFVPSALVEKSYGFAVLKSFIQGVLKIVIFICYIVLVSLIPDMKRTFMYHGAEHKSIFCHENYEELTVENVKKQSRFHPRCGTSFLVVMMVIGILVSIPFANLKDGIYMVLKLLTLPVVVGLGYEFIRYAGRHDNLLVKILSAPGLWVQRITTKEPTDDMIEVAICSLKASLPDIYPPEEKTEEAPEEASADDSASVSEGSSGEAAEETTEETTEEATEEETEGKPGEDSEKKPEDTAGEKPEISDGEAQG